MHYARAGYYAAGSLAALGVGLSACASVNLDVSASSHFSKPVTAQSGCDAKLAYARYTIARSGTGDAQAQRISGFPFLRVNRLLARIGQRFKGHTSTKAYTAWAWRLRALDAEGLSFEIANLDHASARQLAAAVVGGRVRRSAILADLNRCADRELAVTLNRSDARRRIVEAAWVPARYSNVARSVGVFALTSIPVRLGWERWKQTNLASFSNASAPNAATYGLVTVRPPGSRPNLSSRTIARIVMRSRDPLLGIPEPRKPDRLRLLRAFAPVWQISADHAYDRFGVPVWNAGGILNVDIRKPTVYTRISHVVMGSRVLLQLNYLIWFRERPRDGPFDPLAGKLDGVIWRVTLGLDGRPLVYDSIHACGCYHLVFPARADLVARAERATARFRERPAVLDAALRLPKGRQVVLRLASGSHYLTGLGVSDNRRSAVVSETYAFADARELRSLPLPNGRLRRSLYRDDGLVAGTERLERFVLWPTGVASPGAMRQWGHHAVAFVDRRHFDDPDLFEKILGW